ncbi:M24 family metallopeptidase [Mesorhizobium sp. IMUNJ 23232]|uniref:M24 family metallopeptidase n=1 Tax=Mesorhizobium sp. IMUNJ 23232 TaxID=3376064 RepID=UPI0037A3ECDD
MAGERRESRASLVVRIATEELLMPPADPAPDAPVAELNMRVNTLRREMGREDIGFLVLTDRKNIEYLTDYKSLSWGYHSRPLFVVVDHHDVVAIVNRTEARNLESKSRPFDVAYYDGYLAEGARALVQTLADRDPDATERTGIDYGQDMFGRGSLQIVEGLKSRGARAPLVDGTGVLWRTRMIKSPFEAQLKRTSFSIVNAAFDDAVAAASLGVSEIELCRNIQSRIVLNGADSFDPIAMTFCRGTFNYSRPPTDARLQPGQYVWTDFRSTYSGYPADRNRTARGGDPEPWEVDIYSKVRAVTVELASGIRSGMTCGDVFDNYERLWGDAGLPAAYGLVSRIGHGGGLDVTEPPSISRGNTDVIAPGMILHLEPKLELDGAVFQFEEVVYIKDDGVEFLSSLSPERVPVIR